jgi:hypothetical protein
VASVAGEATEESWIARAERTTCVALRREIEAAEERQMCTRGELRLEVPRGVHDLLRAAIRAVRASSDAWLGPGACLARIAAHFVATWKPILTERSACRRRILGRCGGFCEVPGCSRAAAHLHHVRFRSAGGGHEDANLVALCAPHHLHGVHAGYVRVRGQAPDALLWELGVSRGREPLATYFTGKEVTPRVSRHPPPAGPARAP